MKETKKEANKRTEFLTTELFKYWESLQLSLKIIIGIVLIISVLSIISFIIIKIISNTSNTSNTIMSLVTIFFALGIMAAGVSLAVGGLRRGGL